MLDWMYTFCESPLDDAHRVPGIRAPVYIVVTPVRRTTLRFLLAEQFRTISLIEFRVLP